MPVVVDRAELQRLLGEGAQLVEVLPRYEYDQEHLPSAISLPLRRIETEAGQALDPTRPIVVYCWDSA
jgi:rhodanese-related sulfurtransferase